MNEFQNTNESVEKDKISDNKQTPNKIDKDIISQTSKDDILDIYKHWIVQDEIWEEFIGRDDDIPAQDADEILNSVDPKKFKSAPKKVSSWELEKVPFREGDPRLITENDVWSILTKKSPEEIKEIARQVTNSPF